MALSKKEIICGIVFVGVGAPILPSFSAVEHVQNWFGGLNDPVMCSDGKELLLSGDILHTSYPQWARLLSSLPDTSNLTLYLDSRGGSTETAMDIANDVSKLGITTVVAANTTCESSCGIVFSIGKNRIMDPTAVIKFHSEAWGTESFRIMTSSKPFREAYGYYPKLLKHLVSIGALDKLEPTAFTANELVQIDPTFVRIEPEQTQPLCEADAVQ